LLCAILPRVWRTATVHVTGNLAYVVQPLERSLVKSIARGHELTDLVRGGQTGIGSQLPWYWFPNKNTFSLQPDTQNYVYLSECVLTRDF